jgi:acyl-CoA synthetase (AMP-forming)/AMP-acid ligase II
MSENSVGTDPVVVGIVMNLSDQHMNIGRNFARVANKNPNHEAIVAADITLSYSKLWRIVRGFATRMQEIGINRDSTVAVHSSDMIACIASMMATSLLGARYVSLEKRLLGDSTVSPTHFLCSPDVSPYAGANYYMMDASWPQAAAPAPNSDGSEFAGYADADDPWWYVHTSGTTGEPKYLIISQRDVYYRSLAVRDDFRSLHSRFCSLFPCNTRPFFARANAALLNACTIVDSIDISFMQAHGVNLICGAPRTAVGWLGGRRISPKIAVLQVSGAKLSDVDAAFLLQSFETVEDVYGASETNKSFVNVKALAGGGLTTRGRPLDSEVQIVGSNGALITAPGLQGSVRIRNNYMASAYIGAPKASERAFRDGWFYPGDLASWGPSGELVVAGRVDEIINLGGVKVDPASIDETLCSVEGISSAATFCDPTEPTPPRLMAMVTIANLAEADKCVAAAHLACSKRFGSDVAPRVIIVVPSIPMTSDGAPRRTECQRLAHSFMNANNQDNAILFS